MYNGTKVFGRPKKVMKTGKTISSEVNAEGSMYSKKWQFTRLNFIETADNTGLGFQFIFSGQ